MMDLTCEYGKFVDNGNGYLINTPLTPRAYTNVMVSDDGYLTEITQWGTGSSSFQFEDGEINNIIDGDNKTVYLKDEDSCEVWCPGVYPMMSSVDNFSSLHSDVYSKVSSTFNEIHSSWRTFVPRKGCMEIWTVTLKNLSNRSRKISVVPALKPLLTGFDAPRFFGSQVQYSTSSFYDELNGMYFKSGNPNPKNKKYNLLLATSQNVSTFCGEAEIFLGAPLSMHYPSALINSNFKSCNGLAGEPFMCLQSTVILNPNEEISIDYLVAICDDFNDAKSLTKIISTRENVEKLFNEDKNSLHHKRQQLTIDTPEQGLNYFVNMWLKKGLEYGLRKKDANRDNLQFADGLTLADPKRVKKELRKIFAWQYQDGHTLRSFAPLDTVYYCDGPLWLIITTCGYIKFTDDVKFLDEIIPFYDGSCSTVLEHLIRGMDRIEQDKGPHGLPLAKFADWNDALNLIDPQAESVFMAMAYGVMLNEMSALMKYIGKCKESIEYANQFNSLKNTVNNVAWDDDGGYYVRGFQYDDIVGGSKSDGSTIYINPQTWSILSGIVTPERLSSVLNAIDKQLNTPYGCPVNLPAFSQYDPNFGRISAQLPGTWENGSSYCHVTSFKSTADTLIGRGDEALESLLKIFPNHHNNPLNSSGAHPYTLTSSYSTNPDILGKAGRPWLTGTQAWAIKTIVEGLIGIKREYGGFLISSALPSTWKTAKCTIKRNNETYNFKVTACTKKEEKQITLDGNVIQGNFIPFQQDGEYNINILI